MIRTKNDMMEEIKAQVRSANDASERIKKTKRDKVKIKRPEI